MEVLRKYGVETTIFFPLIDAGASDFENTPVTFASGDSQILITGNSPINATTTNNPVHQALGIYALTLTATEMQNDDFVVTVIDQTATKEWEDQAILMKTHGNASAGLVFDLDQATPAVNTTQISGDATAADNLELQYDTTGLSGDTFPATQLQIGNVASTGAATNTPAASDVVTVGTEVNTYAVTAALDGIYHEISDVAGQIDFYYEFDVGANGTPTSITFTGHLVGGNDDLDVFAYNFSAASWEQIGNIQGSNSITDTVGTFNLLSSQVGTGANLGKVRVRGYKASGLSSATMHIDQSFLSFATVFQSVGYAAGAVWVDTVNGTAGTTNFVNGTADNPVLTWADALTLAASIGLKLFHIISGSSITLTSNSDNYEIFGQAYNLALGGQPIADAYIKGGNVSGIGTGGGTIFEDCPIGDVTLEPSIMRRCYLSGTITNAGVGDWFINHSMSRVAGAGSPVFDFGTAIGNTNLNMRLWSGGIQLESMSDTGTDLASIEGFGNITEGTCTNGTVTVRGNFTTTGITNIILSDNARYDIAQVNAQCDTALADFWTDPATLVDLIWDEVMTGHTTNQSAGKILKGISEGWLSAEGTVNDASATATSFITDLTNVTTSFYSDATLVFITGSLKGQARVISSYNGTTKTVTFDEAFSLTPSDTDGFIILATHTHTVSEMASAVLSSVIEGTTTLKQSIQLSNAALAGKLSGGGSTSIAIRDLADSKDRITAAVDADGNRSTVTVSVD